jgi:hypothetical protein
MTLDDIETVATAITVAAQLDPEGDATSQVLASAVLALLPIARAALALSAASVIDDGKKRRKAITKADEELQRATWKLEETIGK